MKKFNYKIGTILLVFSFLFTTCMLHAQNAKMEEIIHNLQVGKLYDEINLSNLNLTAMPDLSSYEIKKLDLSHNKIKDFNQKFLPDHLEKLDLSYNKIEDKFHFIGSKGNIFNLKELNISYNKIRYVVLSNGIVKKLEVNNNELEHLGIGSKHLDYLDISNNPKLNTLVQFDPSIIKTIKKQNIASDAPLEYALLKRTSSDVFDVKYIKKKDTIR